MPELFINEFLSLIESDFRILAIIEQEMVNKAYVMVEELEKRSKFSSNYLNNIISKLSKLKMIEFKKKNLKMFLRLSHHGIDSLALNSLRKNDSVSSIGGLIGVGKESEVYIGYSEKIKSNIAIKFHRLGKSNFRKTRKKRMFIALQRRLTRFQESILSAEAEKEALIISLKNGVRVPLFVGHSRHIVVTQYIPAIELYKKKDLKLEDYNEIWKKLRKEIIKIHKSGIVHGDLSAYNLLVDEKNDIWIIDWPQYIKITEKNALEILERDIENLKRFFPDNIDVKLPDSCKEINLL